jgi:hypothetical protein
LPEIEPSDHGLYLACADVNGDKRRLYPRLSSFFDIFYAL